MTEATWQQQQPHSYVEVLSPSMTVFRDGAYKEVIKDTSKVMLKILQAGLQQYLNHEIPDVQTGFKKGRVTRDQIANICWIIEKTSTSISLTTLNPLIVWITINCGQF